VLVWSGMLLVQTFGWVGLKSERSLNLLMMLGTLVLPLCGAIPISLLGKTPLDYTTAGVERVINCGGGPGCHCRCNWAVVVRRKWLLHAAIFFIPFVVLYSTFFTAPAGIVGGLVGLLGYWSTQQDVARGGQPLYYYAFLLIPVYDFSQPWGRCNCADCFHQKVVAVTIRSAIHRRPCPRPSEETVEGLPVEILDCNRSR